MVQRYSKSIARREIGNLAKVTPVDQKVDRSREQAWAQVAQTGRALFGQFAQYAREDAKNKAIADAEGFEFERNDTGVTLKPPPMEEGGTIYQEAYKTVIGDMYKREVKTDIETSLSKIYSTNLREPEKMSVLLENSLDAIISNVAPQNQQEMERIGRDYINGYEKSAYSQKENFLFNQNINRITKEQETLTDQILSTSDPIQLANKFQSLDQNLQNQVKIGLIKEEDVSKVKDTIGYLQNFKDIQKIVSSRSAVGDGVLLNDTVVLTEMAQMFLGFDGAFGKSIDAVDEDGNVITYTKESLAELVPNPALRTKMAQVLKNRANDLNVGKSKNAYEKSKDKLYNYYFVENNKGDFKDVFVTEKEKEKFFYEVIDTALGNLGDDLGINGFDTLVPDIAKLDTTKAVNVMAGISTLMNQIEVLPKPVVGLLNDISTATGDELANFYVPLYKTIMGNAKLKQLYFDSNDINPATKGKLEWIESIVDLNSDAANNKDIFRELAIQFKDATSDKVINRMEFVLADSENKSSQDMPSKGSNLPFRYMESYVMKNQKDLKVNVNAYATPEFKAIVYKATLDYLYAFNGEFTVDNLNKAIEGGVKKAMEGITNFEDHRVGGRVMLGQWESAQKVFNDIGQDNMLEIMPNNSIVAGVINAQKNINLFGGQKKFAPMSYFAKKVLELNIKKNMPILELASNTRTAEEMHVGAFSEVDILGAEAGVAGDKSPYTKEMGDNFSIMYEGQNIALIYDKTFFFHKIEGSDDYSMVLINDEGVATEIMGRVEDEKGDPIRFNLNAFTESNIAEANKVQNVLDLKNEIKNLKERIKEEEQTYTSKDPIANKGNNDPIANQIAFQNKEKLNKVNKELKRKETILTNTLKELRKDGIQIDVILNKEEEESEENLKRMVE